MTMCALMRLTTDGGQQSAGPLDKSVAAEYDSHHIRLLAMARTPNSRKEDTHDHILDVAARALRRHGYAGVRVADVMKEAGLTHGGFYAHFPSREALLVEALARAGRDSAAAVARAAASPRGRDASAFRSLIEAYLSDRHLASPETGCPVAALGSDMPRQSLAVRQASALRVGRLIESVRETLPGASRSTATVVAGTMVGTLQLARALGDNEEGRAALAAARESLIRQYDKQA
jgi:TetR/AcrR family transcriptional regulator, transcriptional repressor for nem operon